MITPEMAALGYALGAAVYHVVLRHLLTDDSWPEWANTESQARKLYVVFLVIWPISLVWMLVSAIKNWK